MYHLNIQLYQLRTLGHTQGIIEPWMGSFIRSLAYQKAPLSQLSKHRFANLRRNPPTSVSVLTRRLPFPRKMPFHRLLHLLMHWSYKLLLPTRRCIGFILIKAVQLTYFMSIVSNNSVSAFLIFNRLPCPWPGSPPKSYAPWERSLWLSLLALTRRIRLCYPHFMLLMHLHLSTSSWGDHGSMAQRVDVIDDISSVCQVPYRA